MSLALSFSELSPYMRWAGTLLISLSYVLITTRLLDSEDKRYPML